MRNNIKALRTAKKLTQQQLAEICGVSLRQLIRYENNTQDPPVRIALHLAAVLGTTVEELFPED